MQTTVTARHCTVPDAVRQHARRVIARVGRIAHRPHHAQVLFDVEHQKKVVELQVHLPRGAIRVATAEADDFKTALDRAGEKLRRQLEKANTRYLRRKAVR